jgi:GNAT superfamily N-acetyltransferase
MTSAWLAGVVAVAGAAAAEGIGAGVEHPSASAAVAFSAGAVALGRSRVKRWNVERHTPESIKDWRIDSDKYGLSYGLLESPELLAEAAIVEQAVWDEKQYGNLEEEGYLPFIKNSRTFGALDPEGNIVGMNRMFQATETEVPPFLEMDFDDESEKEAIIADARLGNTEELGTVAVLPKFRGKRANLRLWRMAYRDARERGIQNWGIIMEPERVAKMNKYQGFTFRQLGPAVNYQGGDCAPFIMSLEEVDQSMSKNHRLNYFWFVTKKLKT